jgi:hypothetical protein
MDLVDVDKLILILKEILWIKAIDEALIEREELFRELALL